ncbi:MAG: helix-turn-helix domain-containing protein [Nitrospinae bacterium]|nr:helix-turn-helix domain-containing protein [Nitrospinota bacterium]
MKKIPAAPMIPTLEFKVYYVPSLLKEGDVATILGISPLTLRNERSRGKISIPYVRIGRLIRYRIEDLNSFIEQNRKVPMEVA